MADLGGLSPAPTDSSQGISVSTVAINLIVQHIQDILNGDICKWQRGSLNGRTLKRAITEQSDLHNGTGNPSGKRVLLEPSCRPHWDGELASWFQPQFWMEVVTTDERRACQCYSCHLLPLKQDCLRGNAWCTNLFSCVTIFLGVEQGFNVELWRKLRVEGKILQELLM